MVRPALVARASWEGRLQRPEIVPFELPHYVHFMEDSHAIHHQIDRYFLTFTIVEWLDVFTRLSHRMIIVDSLNFCMKNKGLVGNAWVVMSNHIHLVAYAEEGKRMSDLIRDFKRHTSKAISTNIIEQAESRRRWLLDIMDFTARKTRRTEDFKVWQDGSHAMDLISDEFLNQKVDYYLVA